MNAVTELLPLKHRVGSRHNKFLRHITLRDLTVAGKCNKSGRNWANSGLTNTTTKPPLAKLTGPSTFKISDVGPNLTVLGEQRVPGKRGTKTFSDNSKQPTCLREQHLLFRKHPRDVHREDSKSSSQAHLSHRLICLTLRGKTNTRIGKTEFLE